MRDRALTETEIEDTLIRSINGEKLAMILEVQKEGYLIRFLGVAMPVLLKWENIELFEVVLV